MADGSENNPAGGTGSSFSFSNFLKRFGVGKKNEKQSEENLRKYLETFENSNSNNNTNNNAEDRGGIFKKKGAKKESRVSVNNAARLRLYDPRNKALSGLHVNVGAVPLRNNRRNTRQRVYSLHPSHPFYNPTPGPSEESFFIEPLREVFQKKKLEYEFELIRYYYQQQLALLKAKYAANLQHYQRIDRLMYLHLMNYIKEEAMNVAIGKMMDKFIAKKQQFRNTLRKKKLSYVTHTRPGYFARRNLPTFRNNLGNTLTNEDKYWVYKNSDAFEAAEALAREVIQEEESRLAALAREPEVLARVEAQRAAWEAGAAEREALRPPPLESLTRLKTKEAKKEGRNPAANEWVPSWMRGLGAAGGEGDDGDQGGDAGGEGGAAGGNGGAAGGEGGAAGGGQGGGRRRTAYKTIKTKRKTSRKH